MFCRFGISIRRYYYSVAMSPTDKLFKI
jgi:hypothetical protein